MKIISKAAKRYIEEVKQELLEENPKLWNDSIQGELKQEYYDLIVNSLHNGDKITQEIYNKMIQDKDFMFEYFLNKQFLAHGINIIA